MKITRSQLRRIIKEQLEAVMLEGESDPIEKALELLEDLLSEVQIDAGAYSEPKRSYMSGREREDIVRARTASEYIPELSAAIELLKTVVQDKLRAADEKAAEEILSTRMGSYRGVTLPGGRKINKNDDF